jgi:hypothetical protein
VTYTNSPECPDICTELHGTRYSLGAISEIPFVENLAEKIDSSSCYSAKMPRLMPLSKIRTPLNNLRYSRTVRKNHCGWCSLLLSFEFFCILSSLAVAVQKLTMAHKFLLIEYHTGPKQKRHCGGASANACQTA